MAYALAARADRARAGEPDARAVDCRWMRALSRSRRPRCCSARSLPGLPPALRMLSRTRGTALRAAGRGMIGGHHGLRGALVVTQVAVALVLLVGAGLLIRSFARLMDVRPGDRRAQSGDDLDADAGAARGRRRCARRYWQTMQERLKALPGVVGVRGGKPAAVHGQEPGHDGLRGRPQRAGRTAGRRGVPGVRRRATSRRCGFRCARGGCSTIMTAAVAGGGDQRDDGAQVLAG